MDSNPALPLCIRSLVVPRVSCSTHKLSSRRKLKSTYRFTASLIGFRLHSLSRIQVGISDSLPAMLLASPCMLVSLPPASLIEVMGLVSCLVAPGHLHVLISNLWRVSHSFLAAHPHHSMGSSSSNAVAPDQVSRDLVTPLKAENTALKAKVTELEKMNAFLQAPVKVATVGSPPKNSPPAASSDPIIPPNETKDVAHQRMVSALTLT